MHHLEPMRKSDLSSQTDYWAAKFLPIDNKGVTAEITRFGHRLFKGATKLLIDLALFADRCADWLAESRDNFSEACFFRFENHGYAETNPTTTKHSDGRRLSRSSHGP